MSATIISDTDSLTIASLRGKLLTRSPNRNGDPVWLHEDGTPVGDSFYLVLQAALRRHRAKGAA